ncbi:hypothetical protein SAMN05443572_1041 [Myxococcus fulvus]|uniref:Uncharacterized protein n=1 Tax=Myxococcus fulvus TaxID=33 RepID=A0ABY1CDC0_MYXFU|nr:hypothetical protein SAMN05443572_1041 [Myxococcus fulvus]
MTLLAGGTSTISREVSQELLGRRTTHNVLFDELTELLRARGSAISAPGPTPCFFRSALSGTRLIAVISRTEPGSHNE